MSVTEVRPLVIRLDCDSVESIEAPLSPPKPYQRDPRRYVAELFARQGLRASPVDIASILRSYRDNLDDFDAFERHVSSCLPSRPVAGRYSDNFSLIAEPFDGGGAYLADPLLSRL